jgi:hypothetical protein
MLFDLFGKVLVTFGIHFDGGKLSGLLTSASAKLSFYGYKEGHYRTKGPFVM